MSTDRQQNKKEPKLLLVIWIQLLLCSHDLILDVLGHHVVAGDAEVEPAAALGHSAEGDGVISQLGLGRGCLNGGVTGLALVGVHTHDAAATLVQVAHDVAQQGGGQLIAAPTTVFARTIKQQITHLFLSAPSITRPPRKVCHFTRG